MSGHKHDERLCMPMQWTGDETGSFTGSPWEALQPDTPAGVKVGAQDGDPASLLSLYRQLIYLRNTHPALAQSDLSLVDAGNPSVTVYLRQTEVEEALVILNFGTSLVENPTLTAYACRLALGSYHLQPWLSNEPPADLKIGRGRTFTGYTPLARLEPQTGDVFVLMAVA